MILLLPSSTSWDSFQPEECFCGISPFQPQGTEWPWIWKDLEKGDLSDKYAQDAPGFPSGGEDSLLPADSQEQAPSQGSTEPHLC